MLLVCRDENERLVAEQPGLAYREVQQSTQSAPPGQGLACTEAVAFAIREPGAAH